MSAKKSFMEVPSKEYEIKTLNSLRNNLSTPNRTVDLSDPVDDQTNQNESFDYNQFDYERYLVSSDIHLGGRLKKMSLKKPETNQKLEEIPADPIISASKSVKQRSAIQMINDLTLLLQTNEPNVFFHIGKTEVGLHSLVLLARSAWFRRSWRMSLDENNSELSNEYSFSYKSNKKFEFDCEIKLESELPALLNGRFDLKVTLNNKDEEKEFLKAFYQFKFFLYRGDCDINSSVAKHLVTLAEIFKVDILKEYLSSYYQMNAKPGNIDELIETTELAHLYNLDDLKRFCIELINKNSYVVVNSACWKSFSNEYPEIVLEIFRKKNP